jgi:formylglycine-generating enzyme required for sulfatase activity
MSPRPPLAGPYPGLRPFQKHEWAIFFGREPMIDAVLDRLAAARLVVVHGSSGCGKSSLIKAGVLPRLEQEHSRYGVPWRTAEMRPGSSPLWNLATAIARLLEQLAGDAEPTLDTTRTVRRLLNGGRDALSRIRERFGLGRNGNICILLDQFEELFRYAREIGREEAEALIEVLRGFEPAEKDAGLGPPKGIYAILTMRSDHLGDCGHFVGFAELVNATQYLLPRIRDEALLHAIREPARLFGGEVSVDLAVRLVDESRAEIDALPLVQHALMRLWRQAGGASDEASRAPSNPACPPHPVLTADAYDGLEELLSEHAEEVLEEVKAEQPAGEKVTEYLFRAITEIDAQGRGIRRPQRLSELLGATGGDEAALKRVIHRFSQPDCGFLLRSPGDDSIIDIGHEALIRCWRKLDDPTIDRKAGRARGWLQREREDQRTWRSMLVQAEVGYRIPPAILGNREAWFHDLPGPAWADRYEGGWENISKLLKSSRNAARRARLVRITTAVIGLLLVIVSVWSAIGTWRFLALRAGWASAVAPETVPLQGGEFTMGSTENIPEQPPHPVRVPAFAIGKYEVTFDDWDVCVLAGGCEYRPNDGGWGRGRRPVINVSWDDAQVYVTWLSKVTGETYRLPSEAEWEYAARAGTTTQYWWGDNTPTREQANFGHNVGKTAEVGSYPANPWGLYDMNGNVWEWVEDCWHESYEGAPSDGSAWLEKDGDDCSRRVLRGGSWDNGPVLLRSAGRGWGDTGVRDVTFGFRVARTLR